MNEQVSILAEDSSVLINTVLRCKAEYQKKGTERVESTEALENTSLTLKLAKVTGSDKLLVEVVNLHNLAPRVNKPLSRIQLYLSSVVVEHSKMLTDA